MMTSFFDLQKYAATGIASADMTYYDKLRASTISSMKKPAMDDYAAIAKIVRAGKAQDFFSVGEQIICKYTDTQGNEYDCPFDIVDFRDVTLADSSVVPAMIIQMHWATKEEIQFDAKEPDRPASADYNGQIAAYGWNRYSMSAMRQWINSAETAGNWWTSQHEYDAAPSQASTVNGFMRGLPSEFLEMLKPVKVETVRNYRDPDTAQASGTYEYDTTYDTFWLPSREEEYITANEPNHREGRAWKYWIDRLTPEATEKGESLPQQTYSSSEVTHALTSHIHYRLDAHSSGAVARRRSAARNYSGLEWYVSSSGSVYVDYATYSCRCAPACAIC